MSLVLARLGKEKGYVQLLQRHLQQLNGSQIILCFDGTGNKFSGGMSPWMEET